MLNRRDLIKSILAGGAVSFFRRKETPPSPVYEEIYLNSFYIAGYRYYQGESIEEKMSTGDELILKRERSNRHDRRAVEIYYHGWKLGYIPRKENKVISNIMDQGFHLFARIHGINPDAPTWQRVAVSVFMRDVKNMFERAEMTA